jgi:putative protease
MIKTELLAPCGDMEKLNTAIHFGADAVYLGGKDFGLRAYAGNFDREEMELAVRLAHGKNRKVYVTLNIFPNNRDFKSIPAYVERLSAIGADAVIVSDPGVLGVVKKAAPGMDIHLSTQANVTNAYSAVFWAEQGVKRIVLAREISIDEIKEIRRALPPHTELECFVHGAMCISYSGRCLLSNYLSGRNANRGECVQACRWEYEFSEKSRQNMMLTMGEDGRGAYIMNSRDLNMLSHLSKLIDAGVTSFKIEGRMKSEFYVGSVVNAYRRALDNPADSGLLQAELLKISNRGYTTGFYLGEGNTVNLESSKAVSEYTFIASVLGYDNDKKALLVEQRNRFFRGDELTVLSNDGQFLRKIRVGGMYDTEGNQVIDAKLVQQRLYVETGMALNKYDMLMRG